jgi:hypothetical protein
MTAIGEITVTCPDCGANVNATHQDGCDVARCLVTGMQRLQCDGLHDIEGPPGCFTPAVCGDDIWTGLWPGEAECIEYGWYAYFQGAPAGWRGTGWVRCGPDHPDAVPDLNRLIRDCEWDAKAVRWVKR